MKYCNSGATSIPLFNPETQGKVPETLFYDTPQNLALMEAMLQDFMLGEHLLLVGNQVENNIITNSCFSVLFKNHKLLFIRTVTEVFDL